MKKIIEIAAILVVASFFWGAISAHAEEVQALVLDNGCPSQVNCFVNETSPDARVQYRFVADTGLNNAKLSFEFYTTALLSAPSYISATLTSATVGQTAICTDIFGGAECSIRLFQSFSEPAATEDPYAYISIKVPTYSIPDGSSDDWNYWIFDAGSFSTFGTHSVTSVLPSWYSEFYSDTGNIGTLYVNAIPVPEPEIYAMLGVGLGLMGWIGRSRKLEIS